ncbi:MAG: CHAT domain-containing protein [Phenylobacterium sp.]|uniref:CHAT domain-containing protein n=1 Tax=Phenylobacterium sp. TaxID=1871053 RepID=UPI00122B46CA|nr:CHAT domain-containing protein [Phenylobacterium sp.]TAJ67942.1 MAG: CHAT domain-containing protein [Phenylobacterium sp.]
MIVGAPAQAAPAPPDPAAADTPYDVDAYVKRQLLGANLGLGQGRPRDALRAVDKVLSLAGSVQNPQARPATIAYALSGSMAVLTTLGQTERAHGLLKASGGFVRATLPADSVEGGVHRLTEARLLQAVGDFRGAAEAAGVAVAAFRQASLDEPTRAALLAQAMDMRAASCAVLGRFDCAREALRDHPAAGRDAPAYRMAEAAVAAEDGAPGSAAARTLAQALKTKAEADGALPGAWSRPDAADQIAARLALREAGTLPPDLAFALFQIAARAGPSFDADAMTALGQARSEMQRRAIHQALRLRARRDRLERAQAQAIGALATQGPTASGPLSYDPARRLVFRDFARRIDEAEQGLAQDGVRLSGAGIAPLKRFQAALAPNEAALSVAPIPGGLAYMCVRRDGVLQATAAVDPAQLKLDGRLVQQALTATHPPSESSDAQFPAAASLRLYDALVRPFEACLRPGDRIVWLPGVATVPVPLAALLRSAPPKLGQGYDLSHAEWLVTRHAVSYAGAAGVVLAARGGRPRAAGGFDFFGVGDPILTGATNQGRAGVRGEDLAALAPLPETREELEASAKGFRSSRLLLQDQATERRFRGELVGAYRYLSFATHGLIRDDLQGLSEPALVLTPVAMDDPTDDGLLTASEIADLQLRALFVALSACNTANFDLDRMSQDLPALASAFAVAGVPSTLATLWPVNSETGRRVVSDVFGRLSTAPGDGAADALARAQRAFLAAPPGKAYLHPRFWAPFVVLGDGGALPVETAEAGAPAVTAVEVLTRRGGEVLDVRRGAGGTAARFISDADAAGRRGAGLRLAGPDGEAWRLDARDLGASRFTVELDGKLVVSGYQRGPGGRFAPTLEAVDRATGRTIARWRGDDDQAADAFVFGGASLGAGRAVVAVAEPRAEGRGPRLSLLEVDGGLAPRPIALIEAPAGAVLSDATVTPLGGDLVVTFTDRAARPAARPAVPGDDWDFPACLTERVTWIRRLDARTGALKAQRQVRGLAVVTALARGDAVWLAGSATKACGDEAKAAIVALDAALAARPVHTDAALGASEVRSLSPLPGGRALVAASKEAVFDFRTPAPASPTPDPYRLGDLPRTFAGMVFTLERDGSAGPPRMLDAGNSVFVSGADASRPADILLGGTLGGEAAIFHLREGGGRRSR